MVGFHHHKRERKRGMVVRFTSSVFPVLFIRLSKRIARGYESSLSISLYRFQCIVFFFLSVNKRVSKDFLFTYYSNRIGLIFSFE